jgi:hypothetical protein
MYPFEGLLQRAFLSLVESRDSGNGASSFEQVEKLETFSLSVPSPPQRNNNKPKHHVVDSV